MDFANWIVISLASSLHILPTITTSKSLESKNWQVSCSLPLLYLSSWARQ